MGTLPGQQKEGDGGFGRQGLVFEKKIEFFIMDLSAMTTSIFTGRGKTFIYRNKLLAYNLLIV
jgi:hypothetical protein